MWFEVKMFVNGYSKEVCFVRVFYWLVVDIQDRRCDIAMRGVKCYCFGFGCIERKFVCGEPGGYILEFLVDIARICRVDIC